ncbi:hypothetical protein [Alienimonas chondri]|uniref:DUF1877 family protein n=1 Tax=Alienimonas chondri TaxID=2681879 RepID=A0ABX1VAJ7_9PLAN|nr:hypothetical protein [Alienimonas chondri]NNJ25093.1 hypothetical protein [Alienimonas chondri]
MAGYFIYSLDGDAFTQLVTEPTDAQARALAEHLLSEDYRDDTAKVGWPTELAPLADLVKTRLAKADWYGDLTEGQADVWDNLVHSFAHEPGEACGLDFECTDYESIYWDCAEFAAANGAPLMEEKTFGCSGFRCPPEKRSQLERYYHLMTPAETRTLHEQLKAVEPHAAALPGFNPKAMDDDDESVATQFFLGLYNPVADIAARGRALYVQLDT